MLLFNVLHFARWITRCPSLKSPVASCFLFFDTLIFGITFRVASYPFLNPSISSICLISLLLCSFTSTRGLTSTSVVDVRSEASISRTGWSRTSDIKGSDHSYCVYNLNGCFDNYCRFKWSHSSLKRVSR